MRAAPVLLLLASCVTHATVSRDALRYPVAIEPDAPRILAAVDDDGKATTVEVHPDTRVTLRLARGRIETRARDVSLEPEAIVVEGKTRERRIPWASVRGAEISEPRPWLAFAIVLGGTVLVAGALTLAESDL